MYQCFVARGHQEAQASSELRLGGNSNACNFIFGRKGFSCCVCVVSLLRLLVYFLSFCTKEWTGRPRDGSANYSACRPRSSASHSSCCSVWSFSDKLGRRKKMANQRQLEPNVVLSSLFIPYYFLVSFDKLSFSPLAFSRKKEPIGWLILFPKSRVKMISFPYKKWKICQQEILPNCWQLRKTTSSWIVLHSDIHDNVLVDSFERRYARNPCCFFPLPSSSIPWLTFFREWCSN